MVRPPLLAIALAFLAAQAVAGPEDSGYRLSGVIDAGGTASVAILALPDGAQVLIRKGSVLDGGGTVTELSRRGVRIVFPGRVIELELSGQPGAGQSQLPKTADEASASPAAPSSSAAGHGGARAASPPRVPPPMPTPLTRTVSSAVVRAFVVNGVAEAPSSTNAKQYVDDEIAQAFDLPQPSQVVSVNDQAVTSADQTVNQLQRALANGVAEVTVETPQGERRIYVQPAPPASR
jgi:hypothetical protein